MVDVAALQFAGPSTFVYFNFNFYFLCYLVVDVAALQFVGPSTLAYFIFSYTSLPTHTIFALTSH